jgi:cation diffusion facilitator family transporter
MNTTNHFQITKRVTLINALVNLFLAVIKMIIGWIGQSHALFADGVHSLADLVGDGFVLLAAKIGDQSPDAEHPYGHRRIETLATIIIAILLLLTGFYISYTSIHALNSHVHNPLPSRYVILAAILSIIINEALFRYGRFYGKKINSQLLISNAWHNRSDALTSLIVVVSVSASLLGLKHLDIFGALVISILIIYAGAKMVYSACHELIDSSINPDAVEKISQTIQSVSGVEAVHQLRTRSLGGEIYADVHIQVNPRISVSEGHHIGDQVQSTLFDHIKHLHDVVVHIDPEDDETNRPSCNLPNRTTAIKTLNTAWNKLDYYDQIKQLTLHYFDGQLDIDILFHHLADNPNLQQHYQSQAKQSLACINKVRLFSEIN